MRAIQQAASIAQTSGSASGTMDVAQIPGWERYMVGVGWSFASASSLERKKLSTVHGAVLGRFEVRARMSVRALEDS